MEKMDLWNAVRFVPSTNLKPIMAGRLKGKSDVNPVWRCQVLTENFGPCGFGWKFTVDRKWTEPGASGEIMAFADVSLYIKDGDTWSDAIPGTGGAVLVAKESSGMHNNDEGFKMAVTDALSTAMKVLGVAAEVYLGNWDGSKYKTEPKDDKEKDATGGKEGDGKKALDPATLTPEAIQQLRTDIGLMLAAMEGNLKNAETVLLEKIGKGAFTSVDEFLRSPKNVVKAYGIVKPRYDKWKTTQKEAT